MSYTGKELFELYQQLQSYAAVGREYGIDPRTVKNNINKYIEAESFVSRESTRTGIPVDRISHYWLKTRNKEGDDVSIFVKNKQNTMEYDELREKLIEDLKGFAPVVKPIDYAPLPQEKSHLLVIDPADVHLGKLAVTEETGGSNYNIEVATRRVFDGVNDIISKAIPFGVAEIVIVVGNDIMHTDNIKRTTTSGTPQDTDGQWWQTFVAARELYVSIIELAKQVAHVTVVYCPSNHDYTLGFGLVDSLYSWYRNDSNVTISNYGKSIRHRKYIAFGSNLIGFTHGDGARNKDLTSLMQYEAREMWAQTRFSYWYVHHMHHKYRTVNGVQIEKDHNGVTELGYAGGIIDPTENTSVECIRTPSPADAWHAKQGYVNMCAIEGFLHHPTDGQIARLTSYC